MADDEKTSSEPTLVERWLADQEAWQKTALAYLDSMVHNDEFLVHLGNAMRGSLLAGKAYPSAPPPGAAEPLNETDDRIDEILHTLHLMQGEMRDLRTALGRVERQIDEFPRGAPAPATKARPTRRTKSAAKPEVTPDAKPKEPAAPTATPAKDGDAA